MLGGRDALDGRCEAHALVLGVQLGTLRDDAPVRDRIGERRQFMNLDRGGRLVSKDRRGRLQHTLKVQFAQIDLDHRRAIVDRGAAKSVLLHRRDNRRNLPLHSYSPPTPSPPQTCKWIRCGKDSGPV